ncbi:MAG TPA: bifunctional 4-hydroxy-2-oxoglutarate aldolase/2-dehydro-3-deoxy-phosphogluconate aldolase [Gaiellaceae bacterium]
MDVLDLIASQRFVPVLRSPPDLDAVAAELVDAGVGLLEITLDTPGALDAIRRWRERVTVLAGTVRTPAEARAAAEAGAAALVSPVLAPELVGVSSDLPVVPGALTPTEIEIAWRAGAPLVKLFPGSLGGPAYVRTVRTVLPDVPLLVTGGVTAGNAVAFLDAGAVAVGADASRALAVFEAVRVGA